LSVPEDAEVVQAERPVAEVVPAAVVVVAVVPLVQ
jgi:hypothetical protein